MRKALLWVWLVVPGLAGAQTPIPGARPQSKILWDIRTTIGAAVDHRRSITPTFNDFEYGGTLGAAGSVTYMGRDTAGVSARAALDLAYPNVPSTLSFGFGFCVFPVKDRPLTFVRLTGGPMVSLLPTQQWASDLGVAGELELHYRDKAAFAWVVGLGGSYQKRDLPNFMELWAVRLSAGVAWDWR